MQLGWIDFSNEDRAKVLDVIHLLQEPGAVDELGIGIIRDAFANYFFPGTSTVQTRAKYFLIVPYVLREAGEGKYGNDINRVLRAIDDEERKCGLKLIETSKDGVIGVNNLPKSWVARTPSNIYWNGIKTLGIFKDNQLSIKDYLKESYVLRNLKNNKDLGNRADDAAENEKDDKDAGDITHFQFWDLPDICKTDWRSELTIELLPEEAAFLRNQILKYQRNTLMEYIVENNIPVSKYTSFETIADAVKDGVSEYMREMLDLADQFNNLVYLARVRYNLILSGGENVKAEEEWNFLVQDIDARANVDLETIYDRLEITSFPTRKFLNELKAAFLAHDYDAADEIIRHREIKLKGPSRAKLNHPGEYANDEWVGGYWLDYRYSSAKRIIADIYRGEGITDV